MTALRLLIIPVFVIVLAACGDDSGGGAGSGTEAPSAQPTASDVAASPTPETPPVAVAGAFYNHGVLDLSAKKSPVKVTLEMDESETTNNDVFFKPNYIKVAPGATIAVTLDNVGDTDHNFSIESQKIDVMVVNGKQAKVDVTMPSKDGLRFYCKFHPPMAGAFFSEEGQEVQR